MRNMTQRIYDWCMAFLEDGLDCKDCTELQLQGKSVGVCLCVLQMYSDQGRNAVKNVRFSYGTNVSQSLSRLCIVERASNSYSSYFLPELSENLIRCPPPTMAMLVNKRRQMDPPNR